MLIPCSLIFVMIYHHKITAVRPLTSNLKTHSSETNKICGTLLKKRWRFPMNSWTWTHLCWPNNKNLIYISFVQTQGVVWKTFRERGTVGTDGESDSMKFVLAARVNDDDWWYTIIEILSQLWRILLKRALKPVKLLAEFQKRNGME